MARTQSLAELISNAEKFNLISNIHHIVTQSTLKDIWQVKHIYFWTSTEKNKGLKI